MKEIENNMYYQTNIKTSRNKDINFLQLSYGNFVSLDDYILLEKENQQLKEEFDRLFAVYHSRKLIKKFNDEYDEEDKMKNPNRDYACICPDAEEVYKRYYELKEQLHQKEDIINKAREFAKGHIFQFDGDKDFDALLEILDNKGE